MEQIGDLIDKLSIINIKIWDATGKANSIDNPKVASEYFRNVESMNAQRREYIQQINLFFKGKKDMLNLKSIL